MNFGHVIACGKKHRNVGPQALKWTLWIQEVEPRLFHQALKLNKKFKVRTLMLFPCKKNKKKLIRKLQAINQRKRVVSKNIQRMAEDPNMILGNRFLSADCLISKASSLILTNTNINNDNYTLVIQVGLQ